RGARQGGVIGVDEMEAKRGLGGIDRVVARRVDAVANIPAASGNVAAGGDSPRDGHGQDRRVVQDSRIGGDHARTSVGIGITDVDGHGDGISRDASLVHRNAQGGDWGKVLDVYYAVHLVGGIQ